MPKLNCPPRFTKSARQGASRGKATKPAVVIGDRKVLTVLATEAAKLPGISLVHDKPKGYVPGKLPEDAYGCLWDNLCIDIHRARDT
jgi:hypothetical protein